MPVTPPNNSEPPSRESQSPGSVSQPTDDGRWFAYELHDGLLQWIVGARMQAQAALAAAAAVNSITIDEHRECIARLKQLLDKAAEEGRSLIRFAEMLSDEPVDIVSQLEQFCDFAVSRQPTGNAPAIEIASGQPPWPTLPTRRAWSVLRILQQAIQNAIAHSQSHRIEVNLGWQDQQTLFASVTDDGIGFDTSAEYPSHFGLRTMKHRAAMCRGQLTITSAIGQGCQVKLTLPAIV